MGFNLDRGAWERDRLTLGDLLLLALEPLVVIAVRFEECFHLEQDQYTTLNTPIGVD